MIQVSDSRGKLINKAITYRSIKVTEKKLYLS